MIKIKLLYEKILIYVGNLTKTIYLLKMNKFKKTQNMAKL